MPLQPIVDQQGVTASWLNENGVIHDREGEAIAFVRANAVDDYNGEQLGWFQNGFFRDGAGDAIAFMTGYVGGPLPPLHELPPIPPIPAIPPIPPVPAIPGIPPLPSLDWSDVTWEQFLGI